MSTTFVAQILCGGVAALRKEIGNLQEIARAKMKRLHEMESVITGLNGRPSALSYEQDAIMIDAEVQTDPVIGELLVLEVPVSEVRQEKNDSPSSSGSTLISKLVDKEILKIFYKGKVIGVGIFHISSTEKKGYYIHDNKSKKKYITFSKWSLARKQEINPELKGPDVGNKAVNCFRDGRWIKLEDLLKT
jgi:hypothetical protein